MSMPASIHRRISESVQTDTYLRPPVRIVCPDRECPIHYLTFATSNWTRAIHRARIQTSYIQRSADFFQTVSITSENDLPAYWFEATNDCRDQMGFGWYSWKPVILAKKLAEIPDGDILLYLDAGCSFPDTARLPAFLNDLCGIVRDMSLSGESLGLCRDQLFRGCDADVSLDILRHFGLVEDLRFTGVFPHWEAGTMLICNTPEMRSLVCNWKDTLLLNLGELFAHPGEGLPAFIHNSCDQAVLQCMLFRDRVPVRDTSSLLYGYGVYARRRG